MSLWIIWKSPCHAFTTPSCSLRKKSSFLFSASVVSPPRVRGITFNNIVAFGLIGGGNRSTRRKPLTCHKSLTNILQNVVSSTPHQSGIQTHNVSGDRHWLQRQLETQLPYDHNQDGPLNILEVLLKIELLYHKFFNMWLDSMFCAAF